MIFSLVPLAPEPPAPGFTAPSSEDFNIPPMFSGVPALEWLDKPVIQLILAGVIVAAFFTLATRSVQMVPGRLQFAAEKFHGIVRDSIARDNIGPDFRKYVPYLLALFSFLLMNNIFGIVPLIQFPTMSRPGMAYALAILTWVVFNVVGLRKQGLVGYARVLAWPPGVPWPVRIILTPIEFLSNFILRPVTLAFRLFGNMFAGHLVLLLFIFGAEYMLLEAQSLTLNIASPFALLMALVFTGFEAFIQLIQAYIFTVLTASYIGASLADEH